MPTLTARLRRPAALTALVMPLVLLPLAGCAQREERSSTAHPMPKAQPRSEVAPAEPPPQPPRSGTTREPTAESPQAAPPTAQSDAANPTRPQRVPPQTTDRPQTPPPPRPDVPPFVRGVEPLRPTEDTRITADFDANGDLIITTDNVRRFRIVRRGMPMPQYRNLIVRIDKQNIEWTERYAEIELAQARSGLWEVARSVPANR